MISTNPFDCARQEFLRQFRELVANDPIAAAIEMTATLDGMRAIAIFIDPAAPDRVLLPATHPVG